MYPILFEIGPLALQSLWLAVGVAFTLGTLLVLKNAKYERMDVDFILNHSLSLLLGTMIGARLVFLISNWEYFAPFEFTILIKQVFSFWQPGYSFWGGLTGFLIIFMLKAKQKKENVLQWLEVFWTPLLIGIAVGNLGQLLDGQGYGKETILPWGITFESTNVKYTVPVHPTQIYSILLIGAILFSKKSLLEKWPILKENHCWLLTSIAALSLGRFLLEFLRGDDTYMVFGIRIGFIVSLGVFALTTYLLYKKVNFKSANTND